MVAFMLMAMVFSTGCGTPNLENNQEAIMASKAVEQEESVKQGPYSVVRVVDGDTIVINMDGKDEKVRLIGIDTPESVHPDKTKNVPYGKIASEFTKKLLEEQKIWLEYDVQSHDKYGRILGYVYLDDKMVNKTLLQEGHAKIATFPPNVKYEAEFKKLQETAREEEKGLWASNPLKSNETNMEKKDGELIGNKNTKILHTEECTSVRQMSEKNKVEFQEKEEALKAGYHSCERCNP